MFDVLLALGLVVIILMVNVFLLKIVVLLLFVLLVIPGVYSMISGAPFVPMKSKALKAVLKLGDFKKSDVVYDLGCGDGRVVFSVAKKGVRRVVGYEFSILTWFFAYMNGLFRRMKNAEIRFGNFWEKDVSDATVIVCFLMGDAMERFEKVIWPTLKPGTKVLSNCFPMPGVKHEKKLHGVFLYKK